MAIGVKALPITFVAHAVAIVAAIMVLVWCLGFRGGLAWEDTNKNLIFNVSSFLFWVYGIFRVFFFYQTGLWLQLCPVFCRCWFYQTALLCLCPTRFEFAPVCLIIIFEVWLSECWLVSSHRIKLRSSPQQVFFFFRVNFIFLFSCAWEKIKSICSNCIWIFFWWCLYWEPFHWLVASFFYFFIFWTYLPLNNLFTLIKR